MVIWTFELKPMSSYQLLLDYVWVHCIFVSDISRYYIIVVVRVFEGFLVTNDESGVWGFEIPSLSEWICVNY